MYGVEHVYSDGRRTYDIFSTLNEAELFCCQNDYWSNEHIPLFIFKAIFNLEYIYFEKQSYRWNYDDFSNTMIGNYEYIKEINAYPAYFEI